MAGGAGIALVTLSAPAATTAAQGLRVGTVYEGTIRIEGSTVSLLIGGNALAIKAAPQLVDGQQVQAQLVRTPEGLQVRLTLPQGNAATALNAGLSAGASKPQPAPPATGNLPPAPAPGAPPQSLNAGGSARAIATPSSSPPPPPSVPGNASTAAAPLMQPSPDPAGAASLAQLTRMAAEAARAFPSEANADRLIPLLPRNLPQSMPLVQAAMQVLAARNAAGGDLVTLGKAFALAAENGVVTPAIAGFVLAFQVTDGGQADSWLQAVQRWVEAAAKPLEARLAAALRSGQVDAVDLGQELRTVLMRARGDESMARLLQRDGDVDAFRQAIDRTVDRLTGSQAQNLRAFDGPYLFAELPGGDRFDHAHLHILGDGAGQGSREGQRHVVLDVSLRRLGALWLALSVAGPRCQCTVRVADPAVLPEVAAASDELAAALAQAGFPSAEVRVVGWDGDRVAALASVLAANGRLDVGA